MAQKLIQTQKQEQKLQQRLSGQQMLQVKLLEMPLAELEQSVGLELDDNPALETEPTDSSEYADVPEYAAGTEGPDHQESFEEQAEREERQDALDTALEGIGRDDEMPATYGQTNNQNAEYEEMVYGDTTSFYDKLKEQMGELELSQDEQYVMEYLIGSLDDDGYLRKDFESISDELAVYHNVYVSTEAVGGVLGKLQSFDPPGIGARSLQECLLLQVDRKPAGWLKTQMRRVLSQHYDAFIKKHWHRIQDALELTDEQVVELQAEIRRLNPKPGASLGEAMGRSLQQITPDFIVETADDGTVTFSLNRGQLPELKVSPSFSEMVEAYKGNPKSMSRQEKEALLYAKEKVEKAQGFIEAVRQRRQTLYLTMRAIIDWQHRFFQDGDEADLRPMILKDIADRTGLDISTVSRVSNQKYAQTRWGTFPLRYFFSDGYTTDQGEELSTRKMKVALKDLVDSEDKRKPLSDEALTTLMRDKGFPIARRTVAKYREQLGLPVARLRKT